MSHTSALSVARAIAALLGDGWHAGCIRGMELTPWACLTGPDGLRITITRTGYTRVDLDVQRNESLIPPAFGQHVRRMTGLPEEPEALAAQIREYAVPAWRELEAVLGEQTARARAAINATIAKLLALVPTGEMAFCSSRTSGHFGWSGGSVFLDGRADGTVRLSRFQLYNVTEAELLRVLTALQQEPAAAGVDVPAASASGRFPLTSSLD